MRDRETAVRQTMLKYANKPFEYGVLDCCLFAAKVAEEIEGVDYGSLFEHHNEDEAYRYINEAGGTIEGLITKTLGREPVSVDELSLGDPVVCNLPIIGETLGVYSKTGAILKTTNGAINISRDRILKGWKLCPM